MYDRVFPGLSCYRDSESSIYKTCTGFCWDTYMNKKVKEIFSKTTRNGDTTTANVWGKWRLTCAELIWPELTWAAPICMESSVKAPYLPAVVERRRFTGRRGCLSSGSGKGISARITVLTAEFIVKKAVMYIADVIVMEHLDHLKKRRGSRKQLPITGWPCTC